MPHVACQTDDLCDVIPSLIRDAMAYETQYNDTLIRVDNIMLREQIQSLRRCLRMRSRTVRGYI